MATKPGPLALRDGLKLSERQFVEVVDETGLPDVKKQYLHKTLKPVLGPMLKELLNQSPPGDPTEFMKQWLQNKLGERSPSRAQSQSGYMAKGLLARGRYLLQQLEQREHWIVQLKEELLQVILAVYRLKSLCQVAKRSQELLGIPQDEELAAAVAATQPQLERLHIVMSESSLLVSKLEAPPQVGRVRGLKSVAESACQCLNGQLEVGPDSGELLLIQSRLDQAEKTCSKLTFKLTNPKLGEAVSVAQQVACDALGEATVVEQRLTAALQQFLNGDNQFPTVITTLRSAAGRARRAGETLRRLLGEASSNRLPAVDENLENAVPSARAAASDLEGAIIAGTDALNKTESAESAMELLSAEMTFAFIQNVLSSKILLEGGEHKPPKRTFANLRAMRGQLMLVEELLVEYEQLVEVAALEGEWQPAMEQSQYTRKESEAFHRSAGYLLEANSDEWEMLADAQSVDLALRYQLVDSHLALNDLLMLVLPTSSSTLDSAKPDKRSLQDALVRSWVLAETGDPLEAPMIAVTSVAEDRAKRGARWLIRLWDEGGPGVEAEKEAAVQRKKKEEEEQELERQRRAEKEKKEKEEEEERRKLAEEEEEEEEEEERRRREAAAEEEERLQRAEAEERRREAEMEERRRRAEEEEKQRREAEEEERRREAEEAEKERKAAEEERRRKAEEEERKRQAEEEERRRKAEEEERQREAEEQERRRKAEEEERQREAEEQERRRKAEEEERRREAEEQERRRKAEEEERRRKAEEEERRRKAEEEERLRKAEEERRRKAEEEERRQAEERRKAEEARRKAIEEARKKAEEEEARRVAEEEARRREAERLAQQAAEEEAARQAAEEAARQAAEEERARREEAERAARKAAEDEAAKRKAADEAAARVARAQAARRAAEEAARLAMLEEEAILADEAAARQAAEDEERRLREAEENYKRASEEDERKRKAAEEAHQESEKARAARAAAEAAAAKLAEEEQARRQAWEAERRAQEEADEEAEMQAQHEATRREAARVAAQQVVSQVANKVCQDILRREQAKKRGQGQGQGTEPVASEPPRDESGRRWSEEARRYMELLDPTHSGHVFKQQFKDGMTSIGVSGPPEKEAHSPKAEPAAAGTPTTTATTLEPTATAAAPATAAATAPAATATAAAPQAAVAATAATLEPAAASSSSSPSVLPLEPTAGVAGTDDSLYREAAKKYMQVLDPDQNGGVDKPMFKDGASVIDLESPAAAVVEKASPNSSMPSGEEQAKTARTLASLEDRLPKVVCKGTFSVRIGAQTATRYVELYTNHIKYFRVSADQKSAFSAEGLIMLKDIENLEVWENGLDITATRKRFFALRGLPNSGSSKTEMDSFISELGDIVEQLKSRSSKN